MAITKANLVKLEHQKSVAFEIDTAKFPSVVWCGTTDLQADDIASVRRSVKEVNTDTEYRAAPKRSHAEIFLESILEENDGSCLFSEIESQAKA